MAYVYRHIRLDKNVPFYIGISKRDSPNFERANNVDPRQRNSHWVSVNNKTKIRVEILFSEISYEFAKEKEIELINLYKRIADGGTLVNITKGGDGVLGLKNPKLSERNKSGIWKGKKHTEEYKRKMSQLYTGRTYKASTIEKMRQAQIARNMTSTRNPKWRGFLYVYKSDNGELVGKFNSTYEASVALGITAGDLSSRLTGKRMRARQYNFIRTKENLLF